MSLRGAAMVWSPFPDAETARETARMLLDEKLIACANILPAIESVFAWEGVISSGQEVGVIFKTTGDLLDTLVLRLGECHPYDTPTIFGWHCDTAHPHTYLWLTQTTGVIETGC